MGLEVLGIEEIQLRIVERREHAGHTVDAQRQSFFRASLYHFEIGAALVFG
jgi:hypothetical protein